MSEVGYHVRLRLTEPRIIAMDDAQRRTVARSVLQAGREANLLAFGLPDDHLHFLTLCSRHEAGRFAQRVGSSLKQRLGLPVGFAQYPPKPIADGWHLKNAARYVLRQPERHGVTVDPFREASNLPDLLGLRRLGAYTVPVLRTWLPRLTRNDLLEWLGITALEPMTGPAGRVVEATLRACCLGSLQGRSPAVLEARRAAVTFLRPCLPRSDIARLTGTTPRSVSRDRTQPVDPALLRAIGLQLGLEAQLGQRAVIGAHF